MALHPCADTAAAAGQPEPGALLWEGPQTGTAEGSSSQGKGIATDPDGNILTTGYVEGADGNYDILTCKYSPAGDLLWSRTYNYSWYDVGAAVTSDERGNVIVAGASQNYTRPINIYLKTYYTDYVLLVYGPDGTLLFDAEAHGNDKNNMPSAVVAGPDGSIYVTGQTRDTSDTHNAFLTVKFDRTGAVLWERIEDWGTESYAAGAALVPDGLAVAGHVWDAAQSDNDIKSVIYDLENGRPLEMATYRPPGPNFDETAQALRALPDGRVLIAGRTSDGGGEALTLCLDRELKPLWAEALFIPRRMSAATAMDVDGSGRAVVAGELLDYYGNRTPILALYGQDGELLDEGPFMQDRDFLAEDMAVEPDGDMLLTGVVFVPGSPDAMYTVRIAGYPSEQPNRFDLGGGLSAEGRLSLTNPPMPMLRKVRLSAVPFFLYGCLPVTAVVAEPIGVPGSYEYRFFVERDDSLEWEPIRDYSPVNYFMIAPRSDKGLVTGVMVQVRAAGSSMEYQAVEYIYTDKLYNTQ